MPNPNQRPAHINNASFSEILSALPVRGDSDLAHEVEEEAPIGGDDYAATRLAIFRAAVEIGRNMK